MSAEAFSYDDIYNIIRTEKFSSELLNITAHDLRKIREYLRNKQNLLKKQTDSPQIFSSQKRAKVQLEIDNTLRTLKDLYDYREKKVINRAVFSVRDGSVLKDTTNMLKHEVEFYNVLLKVIPQHRKSFFDILDPEKTVDSDLTEDKTKNDKQKEEVINTVKVKFKKDIGAFVAEDLKSYGPYSAGTETDVPEKIANLLRGENKVEMVLDTSTSEKDEVPETNKDILSEV